MPIYEDNTKPSDTRRCSYQPSGRLEQRTIRQNREAVIPAYSVKCRIGSAMVWDAEERGTAEARMP